MIHAHKMCTFMIVTLRHKVTIVFHCPLDRTAGFGRYEEQCRSGRDVAHSTRDIVFMSSLKWIFILPSMYFTMMIY